VRQIPVFPASPGLLEVEGATRVWPSDFCLELWVQSPSSVDQGVRIVKAPTFYYLPSRKVSPKQVVCVRSSYNTFPDQADTVERS
jgi:hypothetical protein